MIKLVLIALAILFLLPLLRRKEKPAEPAKTPDPKPLPPASKPRAKLDAPAKGAFGALMRTVVLLHDNDWSACSVDGVKEDWARFASEPVRGFEAVPAGRHRIVTKIGDREAVLDFVLFPGAAFSRRLDRDAARWVDAEATAADDTLVSYRSVMGIARVQSGRLASPEAAFDAAMKALEALVDAGSADGEELASAIGESLIGIPLVAEQIEAFVALARRDPTGRIVEAALPGILQTPRDS